MLEKKLLNLISQKKTLLGVGPMSLNCVDASIELSNEYNTPIILIASRRQIDSKNLGGGYVNNWNTEDYSQYVRKKDKKQKIILARDHGGPWQNNIEIKKKLNLRDSMESAKNSFETDIKNNFQIIHIDTSIDIYKKLSFIEAFDRLCELYRFCIKCAAKNKKDVIFEIGTEEQNGSTNTPIELRKTLKKFYEFCKKNKFKKPSFVVVQSGTKVMETKNIGSFESPLRIENELPVEIQLPKMIEICNDNNIFMKEHNADYLTKDSLNWHPKLGIHSANIAPEFGVTETRALVEIFNEYNLRKLKNDFLKISYDSKKWKKWMLKNSSSTDYDKAIISGHYVFSNVKFLELKSQAISILKKKRVNLDKYLKDKVKLNILKYLKAFNLT